MFSFIIYVMLNKANHKKKTVTILFFILDVYRNIAILHNDLLQKH